jgi:6,7-dimethyl-8-ribityllumazine synthase
MPGILQSVSGKSKLKLGNKKFSIVVAEWNEEITEPLFQGAHDALIQLGVKKSFVKMCQAALSCRWLRNGKLKRKISPQSFVWGASSKAIRLTSITFAKALLME